MKIILTNKQNELLKPDTKEVVLFKEKPILINENIKKEDTKDIYGYVMEENNEHYLKPYNIDTNKYNVYAVDSIVYGMFKCISLNNIIEKIKKGEPIGYKALDKDMCAVLGDGMQYEIGKEYSISSEDELEMCSNGYHFSLTFENAVWNYDENENIRVFKIIIPLYSVLELNEDKCCSSKIILSEEINPEQYIEENDINLNDIKFSSTCFKYSNQFLESLIERDLHQAFNVINSQLDIYEYEDDDLLDKLMDKVRKSDEFDEYDRNTIINYSIKRSLELIEELDIRDLNYMTYDVIKALPESYFRKNEKVLLGIERLHVILTPEICFNNFNEPLIQRYIKEGNADFYIFNKLFKEKNDWFVNNPKVLDEYFGYICIKYSEYDFKKLMYDIDNDYIFRSKITNFVGVNDFDLFKLCFNRSKIKIKDYKNIKIKTGEQLKFVIKKCGNNTNLILDIIKNFNKENMISKRLRFLIKCMNFNLSGRNECACYFRYYSKKLNKMSRKNKKVLKMIRSELGEKIDVHSSIINRRKKRQSSYNYSIIFK